MREITLADGRIVEFEWLSCALTGGVNYEDEYFHAHQDVAYFIPGLIICVSERHFYSMDELMDEEAMRYMWNR